MSLLARFRHRDFEKENILKIVNLFLDKKFTFTVKIFSGSSTKARLGMVIRLHGFDLKGFGLELLEYKKRGENHVDFLVVVFSTDKRGSVTDLEVKYHVDYQAVLYGNGGNFSDGYRPGKHLMKSKKIDLEARENENWKQFIFATLVGNQSFREYAQNVVRDDMEKEKQRLIEERIDNTREQLLKCIF